MEVYAQLQSSCINLITYQSHPTILYFYIFYLIVTIGLSVYGIVILSKAIGYAHQFSALRGFGTILIYVGIVFVVVFFIGITILGILLYLSI